MAFLNAGDTISGQEGRAYTTIDGKYEEMFYIKTLEASIEKQKAEIKTLGHRGLQHKATGWSGTGSMTIYYVTSQFRQLMLDYVKTGVDKGFEVQITNEDPTSTIGAQTVTLYNVNLNSVIMGKLDTESEALEEELEFTFTDIDIVSPFSAPASQG
ncbi:phage tail tube protein [Paenibacillus radicis (ex Gao et al. 2016)]|uniref:Phage protein n=1 Tax=Paenibacillus radicis (ex Gao et al. 2016) TaxID=1737354 RepID=A0A917HJZ2_9BACL|nr:phage tail tube protein [Paenibacillus radicis (ex Gao et al. 2016)]GGG81803.1 phage protein [Paenibacillus radicis (ex Gao et al. 2016)]